MAENPQQQPPKTQSEPAEEKLEFLKREEVRTMAKDIAKVREKQAAQRRERIAGLQQNTPPSKPQVVLSQEPSAKKPEQQQKPRAPLIPRRSLKPKEKLFIRLLVGGIILFLVMNALAFGFWYFFQREVFPQAKEEEPQVQTPPLPPEPIQPLPPPAPAPVSFFEAPKQELVLENTGELLSKLQEFLSAGPPPGFLHLVVKTEETVLSKEQFLEGTNIAVPEALKEKLAQGLMLFSYAADGKNRLGIVFELKDTEGVSETLQAWETSFEQDTSSFFAIIGGKGSAYAPVFRSASYLGVPVRFQTFSVIDFGIVYGIIGSKLLLTSSFESFQRAGDKLQGI